jgi:hypothetical protein
MMTLSPELLAALHNIGLVVESHRYANNWYAGIGVEALGGGDIGPFEDDEIALIAGVGWLVRLALKAKTERDAMWLDLRQTKKALEAAQAELRAEREANGQ